MLCKLIQKVRPVVDGIFDSSDYPEPLDFLIISRQQDIWNTVSVELYGMSVLGIFQYPVLETLLRCGALAQGFGKKPCHAVADSHSGNLTSGEDEITYGNLLVHIAFYACIGALEVSADKNQVLHLRQFVGFLLIIWPAFRGQKDNM